MKKLVLILCLLTACSGVTIPVSSPQSNTLMGWGYGRDTKTGEPVFTNQQIQAMQTYNCLYRGDVTSKNLYLTFDCGYEYQNLTASVLDVLKAENVPAAFFITGQYLKENQELVKRMVDEGHIVGNHTDKHPSLPSLSDEQIKTEFDTLSQNFKQLCGVDMIYTRPPRGEYSDRTLDITQKLGYTNVMWSFAYKDWEVDNQKGKQYAFDKVTSGVKNGAIILLHSVSRDNALALNDIITHLKQNGYTFLPLTELKFS